MLSKKVKQRIHRNKFLHERGSKKLNLFFNLQNRRRTSRTQEYSREWLNLMLKLAVDRRSGEGYELLKKMFQEMQKEHELVFLWNEYVEAVKRGYIKRLPDQHRASYGWASPLAGLGHKYFTEAAYKRFAKQHRDAFQASCEGMVALLSDSVREKYQLTVPEPVAA